MTEGNLGKRPTVDVVDVKTGGKIARYDASGGIRFHPSRGEVVVHLLGGRTATFSLMTNTLAPRLAPRRR